MRLLRCTQAIAAIEFALVLPLLLIFFLGTLEVARFALIHIKLDKTAHAMADFLTQGNVVRFSDMDSFASSATQIMEPYDFNGSIIFTAATHRDVGIPPCTGSDVTCISWQYRPIGGNISRVGSPGGHAVFPGGYLVQPDQIAIAAEAFYNFAPLMSYTGQIVPELAPHTMYKISVYKPRQIGSLANPPI